MLLASTLSASPSMHAAAVAEPDGFWVGDAQGEVPTTLKGGRVIDLASLQRALTAGAVAIDVSRLPHRPEGLAADALWMPPAHKSIPASLWLPGAGEGRLSEQQDHDFRARLLELTHGNGDAVLIFYCHEHCWLSWNAAKRAVSYGYRRIEWYPEGIEGWNRAQLPTAAAAADAWSSTAP